MTSPVLDLREISVLIGGVQVLTDIDLAIVPGESVGIIGPNGAGKTTLFNVASGYMKPTGGQVVLDGDRIDGRRPHKIARRGLVRTFQNVGGFGDLTIRDNLVLATRGRRPRAVDEIRELLSLEGSWDNAVKDCSLATRKLIGIALAAVRAPRVLLLDEPLAGLDTEDRDHVVEMVRRVHESGVTICLIEHDIGRTRALVQRMVVLDAGRKVADGTPQELSARTDLVDAYLS